MKWFVTFCCKILMALLCKIEADEMKKIRAVGPLIVCTNHTGTLEAPIFYTQLSPRPLTGIAKVESWDNWFFNWIFTLWNIIPIRRGESDMEAMRAAIDALEKKTILGMSPEGTRSQSLLRAKPGIVILAMRSNSPIQVAGHWGGEKFGENIKRLKRTDFKIRVGPAFYFDARGERVTKEIRQQMADEMMYQLAKLLPAEYRGAYADLENATEQYLRFVED